MSVEQLLNRIDRLEQRMLSLVGAIVDFAPITRTGADGSHDGVNFQGDPRDRERSVRRVSPWGISGRPVAGAGVLAAIVKAVGASFGGMAVGIASDTYGPQDLASGETVIWNKVTGCTIKLDENGAITINAPAGQKVTVNGGNKAVARVDDLVIGNTTMLTWISAVSALFNAAPGPMVSAPGTVVAPTDFGKISTGAARFDA